MNGAVIDMSLMTTRMGRACQPEYALEVDRGFMVVGLKRYLPVEFPHEPGLFGRSRLSEQRGSA